MSDHIFPIRSVLESGSYVPLAAPDDATSLVESEVLVWSNGRFINCDEEPIHIPGSIQSYGALIAIEQESWVVRQVSENSADVIGISAQELLRGVSLKSHLSPKGIDILQDHIDSVSHFPEDSGPDVFRIFFMNIEDSTPLYCALHCNEENEKLLILEFAREDDTSQRPLYVKSDREKESVDLDSKAKRRCSELSDALHKFTNEKNFVSLSG